MSIEAAALLALVTDADLLAELGRRLARRSRLEAAPEPAQPVAEPVVVRVKQTRRIWTTPLRAWAVSWAGGRGAFRACELMEAAAAAGYHPRSAESVLYRGVDFERADYGLWRLAEGERRTAERVVEVRRAQSNEEWAVAWARDRGTFQLRDVGLAAAGEGRNPGSTVTAVSQSTQFEKVKRGSYRLRTGDAIASPAPTEPESSAQASVRFESFPISADQLRQAADQAPSAQSVEASQTKRSKKPPCPLNSGGAHVLVQSPGNGIYTAFKCACGFEWEPPPMEIKGLSWRKQGAA